jgi:tetratricopeptide (TPR) repeat protein
MRALHEHGRMPIFDLPTLPIVQKCLEKDPRHRYDGFEHLRRDLEAVLKRECNEVVTAPVPRQLEAWELCIKGAALAALGDHKEAIPYYDKALGLIPEFADVWNNKGLSLQQASCLQQALNCFETAIRHNANSAAAWSNMGSCLSSLFHAAVFSLPSIRRLLTDPVLPVKLACLLISPGAFTFAKRLLISGISFGRVDTFRS